MSLEQARKELERHGSKEKAKVLQGFFKTGSGKYGEGDVFLGVKVPEIRKIAGRHQDMKLRDTVRLLKSSIHEERLLALLILILRFSRSSEPEKKAVFELYLKHTRYINNWDLVDLTAGQIVGAFLANKSKKVLYRLARSKDLWERRISIIATHHFIGNNKFNDTLRIARILISDEEDLIRKAVGWMLREVGKRDLNAEEKFLEKHYQTMPRVTLRYAIEKFPESKRKSYLKGKI